MQSSEWGKTMAFIGCFNNLETVEDIKAGAKATGRRFVGATTVLGATVEKALEKVGFVPTAYGRRQPGYAENFIQFWLYENQGALKQTVPFTYKWTAYQYTFCCGMRSNGFEQWGNALDRWPLMAIDNKPMKMTQASLFGISRRSFKICSVDGESWHVLGRKGRAGAKKAK